MRARLAGTRAGHNVQRWPSSRTTFGSGTPVRGAYFSPPKSALFSCPSVAFTGATWYGRTMPRTQHDSGTASSVAANNPLAEAAHLQVMEGNPLTPEEMAKVECEGWSLERRRTHIAHRFGDCGHVRYL